MVFNLDGTNIKTEFGVPYAVSGYKSSTGFKPWYINAGTHTLMVTPYSENSAKGTMGIPMTVTFTVLDQAPPVGGGARVTTGNGQAIDNQQQGTAPGGLNDAKLAEFSLKAYPNPTSGILNLGILPADAGATIEVYDATGKLIFKQLQEAEQNTIDLSPYASGLYWVKVQAGEAIRMQKVYKE